MKAGTGTILAVGTLLAAAWAGPGMAAEFDIRAADNAVWLTAGGYHMDYGETWQGRTVDTERGWLQNWAAGASMLTIDDGKAPLRNFYASIEGTYAVGSTDYTGQTQAGTPVTTTTDATVWTMSGRLGRAFALNPVMLIPYAELGYRSWDRNITGPGGYDELYHNMKALGGLMAQASPMPKVVLTADGGLGYTFLSRMHAGTPFNTDYELGGRPTWHVGGKAGYTFTKQLEAITTVDYSEMAYGLSPGVPSPFGTTVEPDSNTKETTLRVGLAYHFF